MVYKKAIIKQRQATSIVVCLLYCSYLSIVIGGGAKWREQKKLNLKRAMQVLGFLFFFPYRYSGLPSVPNQRLRCERAVVFDVYKLDADNQNVRVL